jgi:DNA-binding MarR family transcriptional regulator
MHTNMPAQEQQLALWRLWVAVVQVVSRSLDHQLQISHGLSSAEFDVLHAIGSGPSDGLRMGLLADIAGVSKSRLSHCVDRLAKLGWVRRYRVDSDSRGLVARLTNEGLEVCDGARKVHEAVRFELFNSIFSDAEEDRLCELLRSIDDRVQGNADNVLYR